jgi:Malectin domain
LWSKIVKTRLRQCSNNALFSHRCLQYFSTIGKRVFDVLIEGIVVAAGVDVVALTGGKNIAYVLALPAISISDGTVSIELVAEVENPFIAAIEIIPPKPKAPNTFQPILINCGGMYTFCFDRRNDTHIDL